MALPFYNEADQAIYEGGQHFIPQERFRLNYTPPEIMGQNTNAGITAAGVANPYKWPWPISSGDGGAGDVSGTQVTYKRPLGLSPGALGGKLPGFGNWAKRTLGDVQNLYSKLPTPGNILKWGIDKYQVSKAEKEEEEARLTTATRRRAIDKLKAKYEKDPDFIPPTTGGGGDVIQIPPGDGGQGTGSPDGGAQAAGDLAGGSALDSPFAQGGRIGLRPGGIVDAGKQYYGKEDWEIQQINQYGVSYPEFLANQGFPPLHEMDASMIALASRAWNTWKAGQKAEGGRVGYATRGFVDPEEPAENIFEFMQDQGVPYGQMASAEGIPFMWEEFLAAKELDPDLTYENFLDAIDKSPSDFYAQGGIVGLL